MAARRAYRVGAVAYHPRVVTIWEGFERWLRDRGLPIEYTLFDSYPAQVEALLERRIDVAWNTNLAYVHVVQRTGGACRPLAMRDTDRNWTSVVLVPDGSELGLDGLRGKRVGFGDSDSPQAWILPAHAMRKQGLDPETDLVADRLERDPGKHGDTGRAEQEQFARLRRGELDACVVSAPTLAALHAEGADAGVAVAWTSPPFHHCNFTVLEGGEAEAHAHFAALLSAMDPSDPRLAEPMRLEWVNRWVEGDASGYADLHEAVARDYVRREELRLA